MMEKQEARDLLKNVQFPGDKDVAYSLALSRERKRLLATHGGDTVESKTAAAIEIQRVWRGHRTRKRLKHILNQLMSSSSPSSKGDMSYESRVIKKRKELSYKQEHVIQVPDSSKREREWSPQTAAIAIQRAWRSFSDVKVFQYYKDLINFKGKGDPRQMLKCINPSEAKLIDKASGGFVRFRLGGDRFPPTIFYKIFTYRSVVDMCSFSPRDYTSMSERRLLPRDVHNRETRSLPSDEEKERWYQRMENNGWRPLADRSMLFNNIAFSSSRKSVPFHPLKIRRREEVEASKKRKKIQWMKQMYREGLQEELSTQTEQLGTVGNGHHLAQQERENDEDIQELLEWTAELDYENYVSQWGLLATSLVKNDPYTVMVKR